MRGGCRDSRRGPWVSARSQGCPSRAGPALPPPCPVKAIPPVRVTGGAGLYLAQGESVPEAALGREHPWLCTPSTTWVTLGSALFSGSLCPPLPSLLPLHPSTCLSFPGGHEEGGPGSPLDTLGELQGLGCPGWRGIPLPRGGTEICPSPYSQRCWECGHPRGLDSGQEQPWTTSSSCDGMNEDLNPCGIPAAPQASLPCEGGPGCQGHPAGPGWVQEALTAPQRPPFPPAAGPAAAAPADVTRRSQQLFWELQSHWRN